MKMNIEQPQPDELEITTLGPGPSSGESIVVHLRNDEWIIIDSCKTGGKVLPLEYLSGIGVNCELQVKMVICTHWHTDHIQGLPEILNECKNAKFLVAPVGDFKGYMNVVLKEAGIDPLGSNIWNTLNQCLEALATYNQREPEPLTLNARFLHDGNKDMLAIGPSREMYKRFHASLLKIDPKHPQIEDIEDLEGNLCSLALSINFKGQKALIGGDMEVGRNKANKYNYKGCEAGCMENEDLGWCNAIKEGNVFSDERPYHFVKLPHHSSASAYCPKMWDEGMNEEKPIGTTTIFRCAKGEDLPTREMLNLYKTRCKALFITNCNSNTDNKETKDLENVPGVEVLEEYTEKAGVIVCRWSSPKEGWKIQCFGEARLVDDNYLEKYHA